jgi:ribosome-binding protein aMBF1 (putative translation factor)
MAKSSGAALSANWRTDASAAKGKFKSAESRRKKRMKKNANEDHRILIERLKKAREDAGLDQSEVAKMLKKSQSYISKIESGQRRIDVIQLKELASIYKKGINFFIKE